MELGVTKVERIEETSINLTGKGKGDVMRIWKKGKVSLFFALSSVYFRRIVMLGP